MKQMILTLAVIITSVMSAEAQEVAAPDSAAIDSLELLTDRFVNLGELTVTGALRRRLRAWLPTVPTW